MEPVALMSLPAVPAYPESRITHYSTRDGLFSDDIFEILEDNNGDLWMSSLKGIFRVHKNHLRDFDLGKIKIIPCTSYVKDDGMISAQCNGVAKPNGWKGRDGRLWFSTTKGIVVVNPEVKSNETASSCRD